MVAKGGCDGSAGNTALTASCVGHCASGYQCCETLDVCVLTSETCPCPDCANGDVEDNCASGDRFDVVGVSSNCCRTGEFVATWGSTWGSHQMNGGNEYMKQLTLGNYYNKPTGGGFGAGWNYQQSVFFSHNGVKDSNNIMVKNKGVFKVVIDPAGFAANTATLQLVGDSDPTNLNDGGNCRDAEIPWPTCNNKDGSGGGAVNCAAVDASYTNSGTAGDEICSFSAGLFTGICDISAGRWHIFATRFRSIFSFFCFARELCRITQPFSKEMGGRCCNLASSLWWLEATHGKGLLGKT